MKKHLFIKKLLVLLVVLITCSPQMWAGAGFWDDGGITLKFDVNGSETSRTLNKTSAGGTTSLGTVSTSMQLKSYSANVWRTSGSANICSVNMFYRIKNSGGTTVYDKSGSATSASWKSTDGNNQVWEKLSINDDLLNGGLAPGTYTFECWFTAKGDGSNKDGCETTFWYSNNSSNYTYTFIVPSKNLTVAGAGNGNTVSGSVNGITKGTAYDIEATPTSGYGFTGWTTSDTHITIADASSPTTTVTFNNYSANATVTANFAVEETHDVAVSYKCGAMTIKTGTTESGVGVTSTRSVTAPAINDHTFSSWTKGSGIVNRSANLTTNPIVINTAVGAAAANCTLTANYTLVPCKVRKYDGGRDGSLVSTSSAMSYDADKDAYYIDITTDAKPYYYRIYHNNSTEYYTDWKSGGTSTGKEIVANGDKVDCDKTGYGNKPAMYFDGLSGSAIRIWFDYQNKKTWITETTYTVNITSENTNKGTVSPASVTAGKNTVSDEFTASPAYGYKFTRWVPTTATLQSTNTTNPNTVKTTATGSVQAQFDYRWVLRGSINTSDDQHGMPGWSTVTDYFTGISAGGKTGTITVNLEAHTKYKFKVYDLVDGAYYSKASVDWTGSNNVNTEKNVSPAITFTTTASGPYTFTFNFDTKNVAIAYPTSYVINFSAETFVNGGESHSTSTTGGTVAAVDGYSISLTSGWQVKAGGSVEITATKKTGYTFEGFYTNAACTTAVSGADVSISDNVLTFSGVSAAKTVYAKFSENMTTVNLVASPTGKGTFTSGGGAVTSVSAGVTTKPTVTAVAIAGYRVNTSATVWSESSDYISISATNAAATTITASGETGKTATLTATFTPNNYTITLDDNDGSGGVGSATVTFDDDNFAFASSFVAPTRTGYIFQGYYTTSAMADGDKLIDVDGTWLSDPEPYTYINEDKKWIYPNNKRLYAGWTPITYTVTYHANGGSAKDGESDPTVTNWTYDVDQYISVASTYFDAPTKYTLFSDDSKYWNDSEHGDGTDYAWAYTRNLTSTDGDNIDLYAQWYTRVNLMKNHDDGSVDGYTRVRYNQHVTYMSLYPSRTGYLCTGYYTSEDGGTMAFDENGDMVSGDVSGYIDDGYWIKTFASEADPVPSFYAHWSPIHYDVIFNPNDGEPYVGTATGSMAPVENVAYGEYVDIRSGYERVGYNFSGWSKTEHATSATYIGDSWRNLSYTDGEDVTLYAVWSAKTYTISFNALDGDCYTTSKTVDMGDEYGDLPTAYGKPGYEFVGWYTRPEGGTLVTDETRMVTASDHTLYAHYEKKERVYFKNTLGWESVYVTWDAEWNHESADKGAGSMGKTQELMTNIYGTDIWYKDIPASILSSWAYNIAFTSESMPNYANFDKGEAVFRRDFDRNTTMFVPTPNDPNKFPKNEYTWQGVNYGTTYYSTDQAEGDPAGRYKNGYWMKYEDLQAGYTLKGSWDYSWSKDHYIERSNTSDSVFVYTIKGLAANTTYFFKLWKLCTNNTTGSVFSTSTIPITSATAADAAIFNAAVGSTDAQIKTTVAGDYTFKFNFSETGVIKLTVEYPFGVNDYRVVYSYTKGGDKTFSSEYIKAVANAVDTISMFIHSEDSVTAESRSLYIQKCTAINASGVPTWNTTYSAIALPSETASGKTSGVYNFKIAQDESSAATGESIGKYTGNYYIRCDSADGGWDHYKEHPANLMTLSEYSLTQTLSAPYSHYYCQFIYTADISYTIATDYSPAICPILEGDATIGEGNKTLPSGKPASVRFTWNQETNATFRSYLKSAQGDGNTRFLLIHGADDDMIFNSKGQEIADSTAVNGLKKNELLFKDTENWVYELAIKAKPGAKVSIIAQYNDVDRYLVGGASSGATIISGGTSATKYDIAAVYDFKTNRLITTWIPSGTISEEIEETDVLIERQYQGGGTTITFGRATEEADAGSISAKRVIGALKFDYDDLVGYVANWTETSRAKLMYFVSFPFDVNVSDIFGLNTEYGDAFVVQHYNSKLRAEKGFFGGDGTETFWEDMPVDTVMHANVGYVVVMDNDYMNGDIGHVWDNKKSGEHVYLYFPSANDPSAPIILNAESKTVKLPEYKCNIDRTFSGGKLNHKYTDSNWNVMGVPIFQNHTGSGDSGTPGAIFTPTSAPTDTSAYIDHPDLGYFYKWATDKSYTVTSAVGYTFLPMHSYLVQYAGDVTFTQAAPAVVSAPRKALKEEENYKIELQVLNSNEDMLNRTYVELRENAVDSFALNEDLFMVTNKHAVNVYTFAGTYDVSANVLSIGSHIVQVGVIVNQAGTYTFTMPSNFSGSVTLIDTYADVRTNLALGDYEVNLPKGTNDERFLLEININKVPTAIDGAGAGQGSLKDGKAHKFIMNDMLYILKDGVLYDARGNRVK